MYIASESKWALSTPVSSGEFAGGKLVLFIALHSSSLAQGNEGLSLTGSKTETERGKSERRTRVVQNYQSRRDHYFSRPMVH